MEDVLEGIEEAKRVGLTPIKINVVLIKGFNDDEIEDFVKLTIAQPLEVRFIELMPIGEVANWSADQFMPNTEVLNRIKELQELPLTDVSAPAKYYKLPSSLGKIGLISPISCKFCENCNRVRLTATGKLKTCLHSNEELDLRPYLTMPQKLRALAEESIALKPNAHGLETGSRLKKNMVEVGG